MHWPMAECWVCLATTNACYACQTFPVSTTNKDRAKLLPNFSSEVVLALRATRHAWGTVGNARRRNMWSARAQAVLFRRTVLTGGCDTSVCYILEMRSCEAGQLVESDVSRCPPTQRSWSTVA